jgi:hypothetical protein
MGRKDAKYDLVSTSAGVEAKVIHFKRFHAERALRGFFSTVV